MGAKAEIGWTRRDADGERLEVYAKPVGRDWKFFHRHRRFDVWQPVAAPLLEDWLELLAALRRLVPRRRYQPADVEHVLKQIRERFPGADTGSER